MKREWKVGELAKLAGLTVRTLRYYDQIGLFSPSGHTDSGHRIYTESDIAQLQQILSLKELGLSLDQVKSVIERKASWESHLDRIGDFLDEYPDDDSQRRTK